jgi:2-phosphosulfolactate phosphatase
MALDNHATKIITGSFPNLSAVCDFLIKENKNVILGRAGWKDCFNLEDSLFAGAVISRIKENSTIHCDSSLTALSIYEQCKDDLYGFAPQLTHYHRLVDRFGLIEDIRFALRPIWPMYYPA